MTDAARWKCALVGYIWCAVSFLFALIEFWIVFGRNVTRVVKFNALARCKRTLSLILSKWKSGHRL